MKNFLHNCRAASAAEFALVLPAALLIMFGVIDVGRYVWQLNQYEKAVQMGARYAVATDVIPIGLNKVDYGTFTCTTGALQYGETICAEAVRPIRCTSSGCQCEGSTGICGLASDPSLHPTAFDSIAARMFVVSKRINLSNIEIEYTGSGLGYYGDPAQDSGCTNSEKLAKDPKCDLPDAAPIVTVKLTGLRYYPITLSLVGADVPYPTFSYSLTMEDGDGAVAS